VHLCVQPAGSKMPAHAQAGKPAGWGLACVRQGASQGQKRRGRPAPAEEATLKHLCQHDLCQHDLAQSLSKPGSERRLVD